MRAAETRYFEASGRRLLRLSGEPLHGHIAEGILNWPVLVQREVGSLCTSWSTVERTPIETPWVGDDSRGQKVALYDVENFDDENPERKTRLTLEATSASGTLPGILWGIAGGRWYVLSTEMVEDKRSVQGWCS